MSEYRDISCVVIGCGSIGTRHIRNLQSLGVEEILCVDPDGSRLRRIEGECGASGFLDITEALATGPKVAVIATPTHLHVSNALQALAAGCDVFVEKALSHSTEELDAIAQQVRGESCISMIGCNMRFHPGPREVKRAISAGEIGRPLFGRIYGGSYLPDWHPGEDYRKGYSANAAMGGGCVLDGIHEIDLANWYLGDFSEVAAMIGTVGELGLDVEDYASFLFRHNSGAQSEVHLDYVQRVRIRGCVIAGTEGTLRWEWDNPYVGYYSAAKGHWGKRMLDPNYAVNTMYLEEMRHFLDCVATRSQACNTIDDAVRVTRAALLAKESSSRRDFMRVPV